MKTDLSSIDKKTTDRIRRFQQLWRSYSRYKLHRKFFSDHPLTPFHLISKYANTNLSSRLHKIINELSHNQSIISNHVYHWTTKSNLKNILNKKYFYGNLYLKKTNQNFQANALTDADIENGDGNTICFAPCLVDDLAMRNKHTWVPDPDTNDLFRNIDTYKSGLRDDLVRLTLDLNKIEITGKYNEYFKLFDFCFPGFSFQINITENFSMRMNHCASVTRVGFKLNESADFADLERKNAVFYGNLTSINRFCLLTLFDLINQLESSLMQSIYNYFNQLNDLEIKKILITCTQWMTLFSEYNFNTSLQLTQNLIKEVYLANTNQLIELAESTDEESLSNIINNNDHGLPIKMPTPPLVTISQNDNACTQYGFLLFNEPRRGLQPTEKRDFSIMPANEFNNKYINTRNMNK